MDELMQKALAAVGAEVPRVSQDSTRPVFHFRPPAQWMNDVCAAFFYEGWHHIFFQFNPWSDECRGCGWGHARSRDLLYWEFLPPALLPSEATGDKGNASGSATFNANGTPMLFFGWTPIEYPERPREQWAAMPIDEELIRWRRIDIGLAPGKSGVPTEIDPIWTDMFVFRAENRCFAVFKSSDCLLCEAQNEDLTTWKAVGRIDGVEGECPNLFPLEDRYVLLRSTYPISYQVGDFDPETGKFRAKNGKTHILDYAYGSEPPGQWMLNHHRPRSKGFHRGLYGTTAFNDPEGRCILLGWVSGFKTGRGWNGCMSLPRVLSLTDEDRLVGAPLPELAELRVDDGISVEDLILCNEMRRIDGVQGDTLEVVAEIAPQDARSWGLKLAAPSSADESLLVRGESDRLNVAGTEVPGIRFGEGGTVKLHLFFDRSVLEVFINDGIQSVTRVVYPDEGELGVHLFAEGGTAIVKSMGIWEINSVW